MWGAHIGTIYWIGSSLTSPGLKIKRHVQAIGHAQNIQPSSPTPLNKLNTPIQLSQPNTPCNFLQVLWSILREHPCLSMHIEPPKTYARHSISVLLQTWLYFSSSSDLMTSSCGWMKTSLIATNILFKRVYQLLFNDTTGWEIYTSIYQTNMGWKFCIYWGTGKNFR